MGREEQALLAVVNQWISTGATNRQQMLSMGSEFGQEMKLMQHVDIARLLSDVTALGAVDFAESISDGGWLYCTGPDGLGMAVPADSRLFQSSLDRTLLQRMFDGVDSGFESVQFAQIYRPCRLMIKQAPNRHEIVQKGLLQLIGQPNPAVAPPTDYLSLRQQIQSAATKPTSSPSLVSIVREHMEALATRLASAENILNGLATRPEAQISASRIADFDRFVLSSMQRELQQLEYRLSQKFTPPAVPTSPGASPATTVVKRLAEDITIVRTGLNDLTQRLAKVEAEMARSRASSVVSGAQEERLERTARQAVLPADEKTRVPPPAVRAPWVSPAKETPQVPPSAEVSSAVPEILGGKGRALPPGWQQVMAGLGAFTGLGEKDLAQSLEKMRIALLKLPGGSEIRLVHLMETMGKFRVHDATLGAEGLILCGSCDGPRTFEVAVCAGEKGARDLQVLFAAGDYAPHNYPAGYRQLIQNTPNQEFRIQTVLAPAVLAIVSGNSSAEYAVQLKLQWS